MKFYLISAAVFAAAWLVAWFAFIRPQLKKYKITADIIARLDAAEGSLWAKIKIWLEAKKALVGYFLVSGWATAKDATDHAIATVSAASNVDPSALQPLQDKGLWATLLGDFTATRVVGVIAIVLAVLHLKSIIFAAKLTPADPKA